MIRNIYTPLIAAGLDICYKFGNWLSLWTRCEKKNMITLIVTWKNGFFITYPFMTNTLQWRHNEHDGVSNHQPLECLLSRLIGRRSKKTSKLRVTGLCAGNSPETGEFPARRATNAENVSIWWRHHDQELFHWNSFTCVLHYRTDNSATFAWIIVSCHLTSGHCAIQCWPSSMGPYGYLGLRWNNVELIPDSLNATWVDAPTMPCRTNEQQHEINTYAANYNSTSPR